TEAHFRDGLAHALGFSDTAGMNGREPVSTDHLSGSLVLVSLLLLGLSDAPGAQADYASTVLSQAPVAYWRLDETNQPPAQPILATNLGSLGEAINGGLFNGVIRGGPGVLTGTGVTADRFTNSAWEVKRVGAYVNMPYTDGLNPAGPF